MLHPADEAKADSFWTPTIELEQRVRLFGKYPNAQEWLPGDILLTRDVAPGFIARQIVSIQEKKYSHRDACWQHAAIYLGNGYIVESTTRGVRYTSIDHYVGKHILNVRRKPDLTSEQRWRIAIQASARLKQQYAFLQLPLLWYRLAKSAPNPLYYLPATNAVVCSRLCVDAHAFEDSQVVRGRNAPVPAAISASKLLVDVPLWWEHIGEP